MKSNLLLSMRITVCILILLLFRIPGAFASGSFPIGNQYGSLVGVNHTYVIQDKETLIEVARKYGIGYNEIISANKEIDPWVPDRGSKVIIPTAWLIPEMLDRGIVINLAELRLYYFFMINSRRYVRTYPIGIGREGMDTPTGSFSITAKVKDPVWKVPENIREEDPELPALVPPGPDNPLGKYWFQLSVKGYGIHGTTRPFGIGRRVSHGCIRLYPEDIEELSQLVKTGTTVKIVDEPVKVGTDHNRVLIEIHSSGRSNAELEMLALGKLHEKHLLHQIENHAFREAIQGATGLPTQISQ
ncbi:LysM peptidoglycan-binding domain-containing protein [bacterium]|nr:MAG: LysM peptidoglycan-binding domain-containing protein [bacterium]